jgi:hypothetical protein
VAQGSDSKGYMSQALNTLNRLGNESQTLVSLIAILCPRGDLATYDTG